MKIMGQRPGAFAAGMVEGARANLDAERTVLLKAVDNRDGTIVGSIAWGFRGVARDELLAGDDQGDAAASQTTKAAAAAAAAAASAGGQEPRQARDDDGEDVPGAARIREFEALTGKHLHAFFGALAADPTARYLFIGGITVHPTYHGHGVGSTLLRWGTRRADRVGARCYVHASEAGWPVFRHHGFVEVDSLTVDLDEWAVSPPPPELAGVVENGVDKWGTYTFQYGCREPAASAE
jgi:GNAT superfamily N-acetyltransferase